MTSQGKKYGVLKDKEFSLDLSFVPEDNEYQTTRCSSLSPERQKLVAIREQKSGNWLQRRRASLAPELLRGHKAVQSRSDRALLSLPAKNYSRLTSDKQKAKQSKKLSLPEEPFLSVPETEAENQISARFSSSLSVEGQMATLSCYDDMLTVYVEDEFNDELENDLSKETDKKNTDTAVGTRGRSASVDSGVITARIQTAMELLDSIRDSNGMTVTSTRHKATIHNPYKQAKGWRKACAWQA